VFSVPYLTLIIVILLAALAGVAAAILPSRRAAKLNILRAIVTERRHVPERRPRSVPARTCPVGLWFWLVQIMAGGRSPESA
jgi:hypothetical protein